MDISRVAAQEKLFKRAVARSQSPAAFGSALSVKEPETRGRRLSFDEANEVKCHVSYHAHADEGMPWGCLASVAKGLLLGFGAWTIPVSLIYRRPTGFRRGVAVALFFGSFRAVSCTLFRLLRQRGGGLVAGGGNTRFVNAFAGFASGALFSVVDPDVKNAVFVFWIALRALRTLLPSVPFGDVALMMLSASNILSAYVHRPTDNSPSYAAFLMKFGGKSAAALAPYRANEEGPHLCPRIHPGQGCLTHFVTFTAEGMLRAVPLYLPVHLVGMILSSQHSVPKLLQNVLRSSLFLSVYCSSAWLSACYAYRFVLPAPSRFRTLFVEWVPGLATLIERPSRRPELATYCLSHALNAYWNWARRKWGVEPRDWVAVMVLALSFGTLLQNFEMQPNAFTSTFFGIAEYPVIVRVGGPAK